MQGLNSTKNPVYLFLTTDKMKKRIILKDKEKSVVFNIKGVLLKFPSTGATLLL
jgi:hypothetical protein